MLFVLALCLCFTVFGGSAFAETAQAETTGTETVAAEKPAAEMTPEELYETGKAAMDAGDYAKALDAGYEPDEEDQKHLDDVQGKQK